MPRESPMNFSKVLHPNSVVLPALYVCMFAHVNLLFSIIDKKLAQSWPWTKKVLTKQQIWRPVTTASNKKALSEGPDPIRATTTTAWRAHYYDARGYDVGKIAPVSPLFTFQDQPRAATGHNPVSLCARRRFHCILTMSLDTLQLLISTLDITLC